MSKTRSACKKCGTEYYIETNSKTTRREDGKRIWPAKFKYYEDKKNYCSERCHGCHSLISECVLGAEYGT